MDDWQGRMMMERPGSSARKRPPTESDIENILHTATNTRFLNLGGLSINNDLSLFLVDCITSSQFLSFERLNVDNCNMPVQGFEALITCAADFKNLEHVSAVGNRLPKEAGFCVAKLLAARGNLKILNLSSNEFGDIGIASISGAFTTDLSGIEAKSTVSLLCLKELNLSHNSFGDMGILALCRGLTQFARHAALSGRVCGLKILRLEDNLIGDKGALCLAQLLISCSKSRKSFILSPTSPGTNIDDIGVVKIEQLMLGGNPIANQGANALLGLASDQISEGSCFLEHLGLARCHISGTLFDSLIANLKSKASNLEIIDIETFDSTAAQMANEDINWTNIFRRLSEAIVGCGRPELKVKIGTLPAAMLLRCQQAKDEGDMQKFYDLVGALDAMCVVADVLQLSDEVVEEVRGLWSNNLPPSARKPESKAQTYVARSLDDSLKKVDSKDPNRHVASERIRSPEAGARPGGEAGGGMGTTGSTSGAGAGAESISKSARSVEAQQLEFSKLRQEHSVSVCNVF
jgi:hypothetical protein